MPEQGHGSLIIAGEILRFVELVAVPVDQVRRAAVIFTANPKIDTLKKTEIALWAITFLRTLTPKVDTSAV